MLGKQKCKMLREIRRQIAAENDIAYVTEDCKYKGNCKGTCPKCEAEVKYLEEQLEKRRQLGKRIAVVGVACAALASLSACSVKETAQEVIQAAQIMQQTEIVELEGEIVEPEILMGIFEAEE